MKLLIGDIIEGKVIDFGSNGEGIIKLDAFPIFVPYVLVGETIRAKINYVNKDYAFADVTEVLNPSNDRIKPHCTYFGKCGGCDLQHANYACQLEIKRLSIERALKKIAKVEIDIPTPISSNEWEYRNKLSLPFGYNSKSKIVSLGYYEKKSHKVISIKWCPLNGEWAANLISAVSSWANDNQISVYNEIDRKGLLRHLTARMLDTLSICIVINGNEIPYQDDLINKLSKFFKDFSLYISVNKKNTNVILGDNVELIYGEEKEQSLVKFKSFISPLSFLQVNNDIRDLIYDDVCDKIKDHKGNLVELYSGAGLLTAQIASRLQSASIIAVEIEPTATASANVLHSKLGFKNRIKNITDDAKHYMENSNLSNELLVLDPPRRGCDKEILEIAKTKNVEKIIYVSCNPQTLARDLSILSDKYHIEYIQPYDMFPQTCHVETVVCLRREKVNGYVNIDLDLK